MIPLSRRLAIALFLSVGLNLFLVGFGIAHWMAHRHRSHGPHPSASGITAGEPPILFHAAKALGGRHHPELRRVFRQHRGELREQRRALRDARERVHQALTADPFDADELRRALAELRQGTGTTQRTLHAALVDLADELTVQERHRLARVNRRGGLHRRHRNKRPGKRHRKRGGPAADGWRDAASSRRRPPGEALDGGSGSEPRHEGERNGAGNR